MVLHKRRDEEIAVIIAFAHVERKVDSHCVASVLQQLGTQFFIKELVGSTLIDQNFADPSPALDQRHCVMLALGISVRT